MATVTKRPPPLVPILLGAGVFAVHLVMSAWMRAPIVQPDELGYVDNARRLALGGIRPITGYYPGLSTLLAPLWWITKEPLDVWRFALWVNSGLCGLIAVTVWYLAPKLGFGPLTTRQRLLVVLVVSTYPSIVLYSNVSMSESLFAAGAAAVILLAVWAFTSLGSWRDGDRSGPLRWLGLGASTGLLTAVHPRGIAVAIAVVVVAAVVLQPWRVDAPVQRSRPTAWARLLALAAGAVLGLAVCRVLLVDVRPLAGTGLGNYRADAVVGRATSRSAPRLLLMGLAGQLLYLTVTTVGLAPLGMVVGLLDLVAIARRRVIVTAAVVGRAFAGLAALGILAMSVLFLNGGDRADQLIYGRYNEGAVVGLLVVGLTWLLSSPGSLGRRCVAWLGIGGSITGIGALVLAAGLTPGQRHAPLNPGTVLAIAAVLRRSGPYLNVTAIAAVGAVALVVAVVVTWRAPVIAMLAIAGVFSWLAFDTYSGYLVPGSVARARQDVLADTIVRASEQLGIPHSCVGFDAGVDFTYFNDRFYLPGWQVEPFDGSAGPPCGPFAISSRPNFFAYHPGSQIVSVENDLQMILYVMPGAVLNRLQAAGWLLPADVPGPLNIDAQHAVFTVSHAPTTIANGRSSSATVRAINAGAAGANPWPNELGLKQTKFVVRVTARWFAQGTIPTAPGQEGEAPLAISTAELPRTLLPGEEVKLRVPLNPVTPANVHLPPGRYTVIVALYQELVGTIPGGVITLSVTITP